MVRCQYQTDESDDESKAQGSKVREEMKVKWEDEQESKREGAVLVQRGRTDSFDDPIGSFRCHFDGLPFLCLILFPPFLALSRRARDDGCALILHAP
jgi:hypothetical protein